MSGFAKFVIGALGVPAICIAGFVYLNRHMEAPVVVAPEPWKGAVPPPVPVPVRTVDATPSPLSAVTASADRPVIKVTNTNVKEVDGSYRYFFDVRNTGEAVFDGEVTIELQTADLNLGVIYFTPSRPLPPGIGATVFKDQHSSPFGERGISHFRYKVGGGPFQRGEIQQEIRN